MAMAGSTASGMKPNRVKHQGNEYIKDAGLHWMDFHARQYDPQLGRFLGVDPLAAAQGQDRYSPYAAMGNQPESMVDPNGLAFSNVSVVPTFSTIPQALRELQQRFLGDMFKETMDRGLRSSGAFSEEAEQLHFEGVRDLFDELVTTYGGFSGTGIIVTNLGPKVMSKSEAESEESSSDETILNEGQKIYEADDGDEKPIKTEKNATSGALVFAAAASVSDGPLPIGEIVGAVAIVGAYTYDNWDNITAGVERVGNAVADAFRWIKGEKGWQGKPGNTDNPFKGTKPHPTDPTKIIPRSNPQTGKTPKPVNKPRGWDEWWNSKKR